MMVQGISPFLIWAINVAYGLTPVLRILGSCFVLITVYFQKTRVTDCRNRNPMGFVHTAAKTE